MNPLTRVKQPRPLWFCMATLVLLPIALGSAAFLVLTHQPPNLWRTLMPGAAFEKPGRNLKLLVLQQDDDVSAWWPLWDSQYYHPNGSRLWLITKETLMVRNRDARWGEAFAVDDQGILYRYRSLDGKTFVFERADEITSQVTTFVADATILAQNQETLAMMQDRIPLLRQRNDISYFADAFTFPETDVSAQFNTALGVESSLRLAALFGIFIAMAVMVSLGAERAGVFRPVLVLLSIPVTIVLLIWVMWSAGLVLGTYSAALWSMWLATTLGATYLVMAHPAPLTALGLETAIDNTRRKPLLALALLGLTLAIIGYLAWNYFGEGLTTGDSNRIIRGAAYIYDHGGWPLKTIVADQGPRDNTAAYPPGVSFLVALVLWGVHPDPLRLFFPGEQTGAVWSLYATLLIALNVSFLGAVVLFVRAHFPRYWLLALVAAAFVIKYVPSARGLHHAGESVMWPLFGSVLLSLVIVSRTRVLAAGLVAVTLTAGLVFVKNEGLIYILLLVVPWILMSAPTLYDWLKKNPRGGAVLFGTSLVLALPFILLKAQHAQLGVATSDYGNLSVQALITHFDLYRMSLKETLKILLDRAGLPFGVSDGAIPLVLMSLLTLAVTVIQFSWRRLWIPAGIFIFLFGLPVIYVFSTWPVVQVHIDSSWERLLVPVLLCAGLFSLELMERLAEQLPLLRQQALTRSIGVAIKRNRSA